MRRGLLVEADAGDATRSGTSRRGGSRTTSRARAGAAFCTAAPPTRSPRATGAVPPRARSPSICARPGARPKPPSGSASPASTRAACTRTPRRSPTSGRRSALGHDDPAVAARGDRRPPHARRRVLGRARRATRPRPRSPPRSALASIEHRIGLVHHRRGEWELAESSFADALAALPEGAPRSRRASSPTAASTAHRRRRTARRRRSPSGRWRSPTRPATRARTRRRTTSSASSPPAAATHAEARAQLEQSLALGERGRRPVRARGRAQQPRARAARRGRARPRARADRGGARALRRGRRPPSRGGAREQRSPISSTPRAAATRRWSDLKSAVATSPRSARTAPTEPASRRSGSSSSGAASYDAHPDGDVRRLDGARRDARELGDDRLRVDRVAELRAEDRDEPVPVVARTVEAAVDEPLHPATAAG